MNVENQRQNWLAKRRARQTGGMAAPQAQARPLPNQAMGAMGAGLGGGKASPGRLQKQPQQRLPQNLQQGMQGGARVAQRQPLQWGGPGQQLGGGFQLPPQFSAGLGALGAMGGMPGGGFHTMPNIMGAAGGMLGGGYPPQMPGLGGMFRMYGPQGFGGGFNPFMR